MIVLFNKRLYLNLSLSLIFIGLVLMLLSADVVSGAASLSGLASDKQKKEKLKKSHHERSKACFSCHKETEKKAFKAVLKKNCIQCHPTGWVTGKLADIDTGDAVVETTQVFTTKVSGQGPGMSVPIYYSKTRIGPQPNDMILIPAGEFIRGTNGRLPDEGPEHTLSVKAFKIDKYEVTNLQYQQSLAHTNRKAPKHFVNQQYPAGKADHPVVYVSWYDAKKYCEWSGKRLPTDIEWEKAARGTDARTYPWGEEFSIEYVNSPVRWTTLELVGDTTPVGAFEQGKSVYGLYDTSGNAWEWTSSGYAAYPGNTRKSENYGGNYRTLKGGSWWDCSFYQCGISAPVYNRSFFHPKTTNNSFGFRCAKDV